MEFPATQALGGVQISRTEMAPRRPQSDTSESLPVVSITRVPTTSATPAASG